MFNWKVTRVGFDHTPNVDLITHQSLVLSSGEDEGKDKDKNKDKGKDKYKGKDTSHNKVHVYKLL